jgi:hypothetical protein
MTKHGIKIVTPSKEQIDEFKRVSHKALSHLGSQSFSKKVLDEVVVGLEAYRRGEK